MKIRRRALLLHKINGTLMRYINEYIIIVLFIEKINNDKNNSKN